MDNVGDSSKAGGSAGHSSRLKSLLPKVLLYDNVSLSQKLDREITVISVDERKAAFTWSQMQRRFITDQAMKQEVHGMNLFPQIAQTRSYNYKAPLAMPQRSRTMVEYTTTVPPIYSPVTQVVKENKIYDCQNSDKCEETRTIRSGSSPHFRRRRRTSNPLRDTRYVQLYRLLSELPVNMESRLYAVN